VILILPLQVSNCPIFVQGIVDICNPWGNSSFCNDPHVRHRTWCKNIYPTIPKRRDFANKSWHHHVVIAAAAATCACTQSDLQSQTHFSQSLFSECARGVLLRISKTRNRSSQFFSLRAGRSKKPFPDGTHREQSRLNQRTSSRALLLCVCALECRRAAAAAHLSLECG
jgi:hypothetical protein